MCSRFQCCHALYSHCYTPGSCSVQSQSFCWPLSHVGLIALLKGTMLVIVEGEKSMHLSLPRISQPGKLGCQPSYKGIKQSITAINCNQQPVGITILNRNV